MAVQSNDTDLKDLLLQVQKGELQLPEFQRSRFGTMEKYVS